MIDEKKLENMVREVLANMGKNESTEGAIKECSETEQCNLDVEDYPLATQRPDLVKTARGQSLDDITLDEVMKGNIKPEDLRITDKTLLMQAEIAEKVGRRQLAQNFRRAAELTKVPDDRILEIYTALRPYRSSKEELLSIAEELEKTYNAPLCANHVEEAAEVYERRRLLKGME
ncbi:MAG TPA: diol dehydratase small subunit [Thermoanaerobacterales bacterium]|jgi:propanediol dehydratase small subunit|nr:diol dehydratase small subunit [Thermoanaerobacterales bacterium]